jgi:hypothetical protein
VSVPDHRASDAEREAAADRLREAAGDGRLEPDELEERLESAYGARTRGELARLTEDLPEGPRPTAKPDPVWRAPAFRARLASFIVANTICITIWAATGADGSFWPIWVLFGTGIGLFSRLVRGVLGVEEGRRRHRGRPPRPPSLPPAG